MLLVPQSSAVGYAAYTTALQRLLGGRQEGDGGGGAAEEAPKVDMALVFAAIGEEAC